MSNQGKRQASVRDVTGTAFTYEGDWHALFDMDGIPAGTFNERMLAWINDYLGTSYTELNGAMAAFAIDQGADSWNGLGTFDAAPPFTPADIPNLALWLDAADAATITDTGTLTWADKSGLANNATQATGAKKPLSGTRTLNGLNVLEYTTDDQLLSLPSSLFTISNGDNTVFVVFQSDVTNADQWLLSGFSGGYYGIVQRGGFSYTLAVQNNNFNVNAGFSIPADTLPHLIGQRATGTSLELLFEGRTAATGVAQNFNIATNLSIGTFGTGGAGNGTINGAIAEIIIYNRSLSLAELAQVNGYLGAKWGVPAFVFEPVVNLPTVTSAVYFGDSITQGLNATSAFYSWVNILSYAMSSTILNQGISNTVLQNSTGEANNGRDRYVAATTGANKRDIVFSMYGLNDMFRNGGSMSLANFIIDYQEVITGWLAAGYTTDTIVLASPPYVPLTAYPLFPGSSRALHEQYVAAVRQLAVDNNVFYVDVFGYMRDNGGDALIDTDKVHPINIGHEVIYQAYATTAAKVF